MLGQQGIGAGGEALFADLRATDSPSLGVSLAVTVLFSVLAVGVVLLFACRRGREWHYQISCG